MPARCNDEDRFAVSEEDQRAGDLANFDAKGSGGLLRRAGTVVKAPHLADCPSHLQGHPHPCHGFLLLICHAAGL